MRLRSRSSTQQQQLEGVHTDGLPVELMQMLGSFLGQEDIASASMVCKSWAAVLRAGVTAATVVVGGAGPNAADPAASPAALGRQTSVEDLTMLLTSRSDDDHVQQTLRCLDALPKLKRLHLRFLLSQTPKKGGFPAFFSDGLDARQLEHLVIDSPTMPFIALMNLISNLARIWGPPHKAQAEAGAEASTPRHLDLRLGHAPPGSQLPAFAQPSWLQNPTLRASQVNGEMLQVLADIPSLASLRCEVARSVLACRFEELSKLSSLTELVLYGAPLRSRLVQLLPTLTSLRRLAFNMHATSPDALDSLGLDFLQELDLGVECDAAGRALEVLLSKPPAPLRGLSIKGLALQQSFVGQLAALTDLTSLQLIQATVLDAFLDLTPWRQLPGLQQLTLQVARPYELMQVKFSPPPPPPKPERVLTGVCQSVGKRRKSFAQQQLELSLQHQEDRERDDKTAWGDISALPAAWPNLKALQLCGLPPYAVAETCWEALGRLTALTSLILRFNPAGSIHQLVCHCCRGLKQLNGSPGQGLPVLRLEHLPTSLLELQLASCYVGVPAEGCWRAGDTLKTLSLSRCYVGSIQKGVSSRSGYPIIINDGDTDPTRSSSSSGGSSKRHPLLVLLEQTQQLSGLELIDLPWLSDVLLSAAAAQPQLRTLSSLSVVGISNTSLTHGGLLGLTGLRKLRELRWHVGSVLELMPDVNALAQLQGLMTVHLPNFLHQQMERWGAYAVLDSMPLCDVNVELP